MTVKELKEELNDIPDDFVIYTSIYDEIIKLDEVVKYEDDKKEVFLYFI